MDSSSWPEYRAVRAFYGERCARRSGRPLIAHIDEGLEILAGLDADARTFRAWCLHPLVQADADLSLTQDRQLLVGCDPHVVVLAMHYREVANAHLSHHAPRVPDAPPTAALRQMLVADKLQNSRDFEAHLPNLENADRLRAYFAEWFEALGLS